MSSEGAAAAAVKTDFKPHSKEPVNYEAVQRPRALQHAESVADSKGLGGVGRRGCNRSRLRGYENVPLPGSRVWSVIPARACDGGAGVGRAARLSGVVPVLLGRGPPTKRRRRP